ncbi:cytochrome P450 [Nocardia sp. NEAU-G5]|uniref:Cytochrome P450 n=1 Tax=Nocardia albiluteola TaxID=2842303 RepID=A0ABS6B4X0_9NOCA|nr:cytochrome P450 [Nocardia albiluteola]MBU3065362.1 cytochrome P450 [Nocardia albiluteola]
MAIEGDAETGGLIPRFAGRRLPLAGHAIAFGRDPLGFLQSVRNEGDIVRLQLGPKQFYLLNSPTVIRKALVEDAAKYGKGLLFQRVRPLLGNGLVNSEGSFHARQRRLMQPAFNRKHIAHYIESMNHLAASLSARWRDGETITLTDDLHRLSSDVIATTMFPDMSSRSIVEELQRSLAIVLRGVIIRTLVPYQFWEFLPTPGNLNYQRAIRRLRSATGELITAARAGDVEPDGLLALLVAARDAETGAAMTDTQLLDEVTTLFAAGTETASVTLSWLFYELAGHSDIEARLHAELDEHLSSDRIDADTIHRLDYCRRVIEETLRLHTPTWFLSRRALDTVQLDGWVIPAGAEIIYSPTTMHRDPKLFDDPMRFDPDRWLPERRPGIADGAFIPFNLGIRKCIGDHYAMTEMIVTAATIARRWRLYRMPGQTAREHISTTVHPGDLRMRTVFRQSSTTAAPAYSS